jgi:pyridoxal phosphate enzyme (YggS family)
MGIEIASRSEAIQHEALRSRYGRLRDSQPIRKLLSQGGELHIASEGHSGDAIASLIALGQRHFAEKYCQEALTKWTSPALRAPGLHLSFFGRLQANKVRKVCHWADSIESIDTERLADRIARMKSELVHLPRLIMQVNTSREPQKNGCAPDQAENYLSLFRSTYLLDIRGVMIIPKRGLDPEPDFRWARRFADQNHLEHCVMGMSNDYAQAIACGATIIRIGRAVWG